MPKVLRELEKLLDYIMKIRLGSLVITEADTTVFDDVASVL